MDIFGSLLVTADSFCDDLSPVLGLVGWVIFGIKVAVPIILIVVGMLDLAKAVLAKDEKEVKSAQQLLVKRAISAAIVFLVATLVGVIMMLVNGEDYKKCTGCLNRPWSCANSSEIDEE